MSNPERSDAAARGPLPEAQDLAPPIRRDQEEDDRDQKTPRARRRPFGGPGVKGEGTPRDEEIRALDGEAKAQSSHDAAPAGENRNEPPEPAAAPDEGDGHAGQRSLLARLRYLDEQRDTNLRFVSRIKDRESAAVSAARSPAGSPEEARATALDAEAFLAVSGDKIAEAEARIEGFTQERSDLLHRMAQTGFFEGRWVNDDGRAVYLEWDGAVPPSYTLHEGPWGWVKDAPPGEDPRETLRRAPLLERAHRRNRQVLLLLGVPFAAYWLASALPPLPQHVAVAVTAAIFAVFLFALPLAREYLFGRWGFIPEAERRLAEESAARAQLGLIRDGERRPPSLDEITEAMLTGPRRRRAERGKVSLVTVVKDPEDRAERIEYTGDGSGDEGTR